MDIQKEIERLSVLSKLSFSDGEIGTLRSDMEKIISLAETVSKSNPIGALADETPTKMRKDEPADSLPAEQILKNAPSAENGFFKLKRNGTVARKNPENQ